ncbi:MAG: thioredoxin family protein [Clostridia bacterium]|nr:thioredoxin family protein [Clostridia bacterium]
MVHHIEQERVNEEVVINSQRLMILDIYADWCVPCQMLSPILTELDKKYDDLQVYKLNADESENFLTLNNILSIPTLIFYKDGEEKERIVGLESMEKIENIIKAYGITEG